MSKIELPWLQEPPSTYVRRHFRFTTERPTSPRTHAELDRVLEQLGSDELLLYGSDFPHRHPPHTPGLLEQLHEQHAEKIRRASAAAWYRLESS